MRKTSFKMHMYDMVTIDSIVFEVVRVGLLKPPLTPPPRIVNFRKYFRSDRFNRSHNAAHSQVTFCYDILESSNSQCCVSFYLLFTLYYPSTNLFLFIGSLFIWG